MKENLYDILGVEKNASQSDIKKAYRKLALKLHPDKAGECKESEEKFKKVGDAYAILSDENKRKTYDTFGSVDGLDAGAGFSAHDFGDLSDMLGEMFGRAGNPFGGNGSPFGFNFNVRHEHSERENKIINDINVNIDICDLYYCKKKKIEKEIMVECVKCKGTGADDPTQIMKCLNCDGKGHIINVMGGGMIIQKSTCRSCMGKKQMFKKKCTTCNGEKYVKQKKNFEFKIPKHLPNGHKIMNGNTLFHFRYDIDPKYKLDEHNNVHLNLSLSIEELLCGFIKHIVIYEDKYRIKSDGYFNPNKKLILKEKGIYNNGKKKNADLIMHFVVKYDNNELLYKYAEVLRKMLHIKLEDHDDDENIQTIYTTHAV